MYRFGQDIQVVDRELPIGLATISTREFNDTIPNALKTTLTKPTEIFKLLMQITLLISVNPLLATTLPICIVIVYLVQKYYLRVSRQLRYLELHARAAVFTSFIETASELLLLRESG